jgi:2,3-bisphosphoglycerate-independent phosphoglycerate mutase
MKKKIIFLLLDGVGDLPNSELGGQTPLEYAKTPTIDLLAGGGRCGALAPEGLGTDVPIASASLMLFSNLGYDIRQLKPSRGVVEAIGFGAKIKEGNLVARFDFATVDEQCILMNRRAGRQELGLDTLVKDLNKMPFEVPFQIIRTSGYRGLVIFKPKKKLSDAVNEIDPGRTGEKMHECRPSSHAGAYSAVLINDFMKKSYELLKDHQVNKEREGQGLLPANFILMRGFGSSIPKLKPFKKKYGLRAAGITGLPVNKGILKLLGIDLIDVKEEVPNEVELKKGPLKKALKKYDFVFVHFKNTDDPGHDGNAREKVKQIELIDTFIGSLDLENTLLVITSDHCTPCSKRSHSADPIPTMLSWKTLGPGRKFGERYCRDFKIASSDLMTMVLAFYYSDAK